MSHLAIPRMTVDTPERRELGRYEAGRAGPTVVVLAGIHGNEPAGVEAARRVLGQLRERRIAIHGRLVGLAGNLAALRRGERFLDRDLNRQWLPERTAELLTRDPADWSSEDREQRELLAEFDALCRESTEGVVFIDLHTSSADGPPFTCMADTMPNRRVAFSIPAPTILGLEECIDGAVMEYFSSRGHVAIAIEGGQHQAPATIDNLESALWLALLATGSLATDTIDPAPHRRRLADASRRLPPVLEIRHRQAITPADRFVMRPGYRSFDTVAFGALLGTDAGGEIRAVERAVLLLPLYQGLGEDGFFLARPVRRVWIGVAAWFRRLHVDRLLPVLPGVARHPSDRNTLVVDPLIARWFVVEVFHLCGFRRRRPREGKLWFTRRLATAAAERLRPRS